MKILNEEEYYGVINPDLNMNFWISHIYEGLYMGGCINGYMLPDYIDHVISLEKDMKWSTIDPNVTYEVFPMYDIKQKPIYQNFMEPAELAVSYLKHGETVFIHCQAGVNRSGLVVAATLFKLGFDPADAIELIRERRFPECLGNEYFERAILNLKRPDNEKFL